MVIPDVLFKYIAKGLTNLVKDMDNKGIKNTDIDILSIRFTLRTKDGHGHIVSTSISGEMLSYPVPA